MPGTGPLPQVKRQANLAFESVFATQGRRSEDANDGGDEEEVEEREEVDDDEMYVRIVCAFGEGQRKRSR